MLYAVVTIDNVDYTIPPDDIKNTRKVEEKLSLSAQTYDITIDNIDKTKYDDRYVGSLFSEYTWYNSRVRVYDDETNKKIWDGLLKNIKSSDTELILSTVNYVREMADRICIVTDLTGTLTPAHLIYAILVDPLGLNIPADNINVYEFQAAMAYQAAHNIFCKVSLNTSHNVKCMAVIEELGNLSLSQVYSRDNIISIYQYDNTIPDTGLIIDNDLIIPESYGDEYDDSSIINSYSIQYYDIITSSIKTITGSSSDSISMYGAHPLVIPETEINTDDAGNFRILLYGIDGAQFVGEQYLIKEKHMRKVFSVQVSDEMQDKMHINDNLLLAFDPFVHEPVKVTEHKYDRSKGTIDIKGLFLNKPVGIDIDISTPQQVSIIAVLGISSNKILTVFHLNSEAIGYQIRMRRLTQASEIFDVKYTFTDDGIGEYVLNCDSAVEYLISIRCYNKKLLYSDWSREIPAITPVSTVSENFYRCKGTILHGITLSITNELCGVIPADLPQSWIFGVARYGESKYSPAAIYESGIISIPNRMIIRAVGNINYQYKLKNGNWSALSMLDDNTIISVKTEVQIRVMFLSQDWSSNDTFYVSVE